MSGFALIRRVNDVPAVTTRRATAADAAELARLRFEFRTAIHDAVETEVGFRERCERWMAERLATSDWYAWIAARTEDVLGNIWLNVFHKVPNPVGEPEAYGYITNLYVVPGLRGGGVGSRLLDAAVEECRARGVDTVLLWPTPRSRGLYVRHGFVDTDDVLGLYLTGHEDAR